MKMNFEGVEVKGTPEEVLEFMVRAAGHVEQEEEETLEDDPERLLEVSIYDSVMFEEKITLAEMWLKNHDFEYTMDGRISGKGKKIDTMLKMEDIVALRDYIYEGTEHNRAILI